MNNTTLLMCIWLSSATLTAAADDKTPLPVSFSRDVAPILLSKCQACHGPKQQKGKYRVDTFEALAKPGSSKSEPVAPGKPDESELVLLLTEPEPDDRMPKDGDALPADQIDLIKRWVAQGAKFDGKDPNAALTSLVPTVEHPPAPKAYPAVLPVTAIAFSPDGNELAVGGYHEITLWNAQDGKLLRRITNVAQRTYDLAFTGDGKLLAAASGTPGELGEVRLFNPADGALVRVLGAMSDVALDLAVSPDGKRLAVGAADNFVRVYEIETGREVKAIESHSDWVLGVAFSPDGKQLATASRDKSVKLIELATNKQQAAHTTHGAAVYSVGFSPDGKQLISAGADDRLRYWSLKDKKQSGDVRFSGDVYEVVVVGERAVVCSADKSVKLLQARDRKELRRFEGHSDEVYAAAYHPGAKRVATGGFDGEVRVWNADDGKLVTSFIAAPGYEKGK